MPMPRIIHGWRTWYVYDASGKLVHIAEGFHEEAARRSAVSSVPGLTLDALTAERVPRDGLEGA